MLIRFLGAARRQKRDRREQRHDRQVLQEQDRHDTLAGTLETDT